MSTPDDRATAITTRAGKPARVSSDGVSVDQHPIPDQIEADRYSRGAEIIQKDKPLGIRILKRVPPGAV